MGTVLLLIVLGLAASPRKGKAPPNVPAPRAPAPPKRKSKAWPSITRARAVARALSQRGLGHYWLGGGAIYTAAYCFSKEGNRRPGYVDCTGLIAWAAEYDRGDGGWNTDAIVRDALGPQTRFRLVDQDEQVLPGDLIVTGNLEKGEDHACMIVEVLPGFVRRGRRWYRYLRCVHAAGQSWQRSRNEQMEDLQGAVRVTDAYRWRKTGYIIRPLHMID